MLNNDDPFLEKVGSPADKLSRRARIRRGLLVFIGGSCMVLGIVLMITMVRPETLGSLRTAELWAIVGLIVMPAFTMLCVRYDLAIVKTAKPASYQQISTPSRVAHTAHDRGSRSAHHARMVDSAQVTTPLAHEKEPRETVGILETVNT